MHPAIRAARQRDVADVVVRRAVLAMGGVRFARHHDQPEVAHRREHRRPRSRPRRRTRPPATSSHVRYRDRVSTHRAERRTGRRRPRRAPRAVAGHRRRPRGRSRSRADPTRGTRHHLDGVARLVLGRGTQPRTPRRGRARSAARRASPVAAAIRPPRRRRDGTPTVDGPARLAGRSAFLRRRRAGACARPSTVASGATYRSLTQRASARPSCVEEPHRARPPSSPRASARARRRWARAPSLARLARGTAPGPGNRRPRRSSAGEVVGERPVERQDRAGRRRPRRARRAGASRAVADGGAEVVGAVGRLPRELLAPEVPVGGGLAVDRARAGRGRG